MPSGITVVVSLEQPEIEVLHAERTVTVESTEIEYVDVGMQGLAGEGTPGITEVAEDLSPSLGGDLTLGSFNINGQLENVGLIIDGGLL